MYTAFDASEIFYKVKCSVKELAPLLAKHEIRGINPPKEILNDINKAREDAKCVFDYGLKWCLMPTPVDFYAPNVCDEVFDEGLKTLESWAKIAGKIGVKYSYNHIFSGSNDKKYFENFNWHVLRISQVNKIMQDNGILYGLEFLGPWDLRNSFKYEFVHTISGICAISQAVGNNVGFLFDIYHWYTGSNDLDDLYFAAQNTEKMVCYHINDGISGRSRYEQMDMERAMPMTTGIVDAVTPYKMFEEKGYEGPMLCEPIFPTYERFMKMQPEEVVIEIANEYKKIKQLAME